jgi:four helix bundle protein
MAIKRFEDIVAWQKAQDLAVAVYTLFRDSRDFGFRDQICRAAVSVSNNIAEGFDRRSDAEFVRFLNIARSSCNEVKSMVYLGERLGYMDASKRSALIDQCEEISKVILGLARSLQTKTTA